MRGIKDVLFMIEDGKALDMVKKHIAEREQVQQEICVIADELGIKEFLKCNTTGVLVGAIFQNEIHPEFTKPRGKKRGSFPKKGTNWAARLAAQKGYRDQSRWISEEFGIPLRVSYKSKGGFGNFCIGNFFNECGFLYLSEHGPYAMWVPDVPSYVAPYVEGGCEVEEPAASFKLEFEGCRRIAHEEWEILVLQDKLARDKTTAKPSIHHLT